MTVLGECCIICSMKTKLFLFVFFLAAVLAPLSAASSSFIRIDDPEDGDTRYVYNAEDLTGTKYTFHGSVSADCVSIRVIWSLGDAANINEYLYNGSSPVKGIEIDDFTLKQYKAGQKSFEYNVSERLANLKFGSNHYLFIAKFKDGRYKSVPLTLYVYAGGAAEKGKPVIYLYPTKKQTVKVSVAPDGGVTESIPEMGKGWKVTAYPDGRIVDSKTKQEYPYLYWESLDSSPAIDRSEGFVVETEKLDSFFTEKLGILGLNENEIRDFCEYWVPELNKNGKPWQFITFHPQSRIDAEAPLSVSPKPDSVIRVFFDHAGLDAPFETAGQQLVPARRSGFAVVEWGGRRYK